MLKREQTLLVVVLWQGARVVERWPSRRWEEADWQVSVVVWKCRPEKSVWLLGEEEQ